MNRLRLLLPSVILLISQPCWPAPKPAPEAAKPKLVVGIVIDQFRYDYLTRFRNAYHGGLDRLLRDGADFTNAFYQQAPTVTAVGHSIFLTGAMPATSGIVGNAWYDRDERKIVTSVCDWNEVLVGTEQPRRARCTDDDPASPRRLLASTLGDELREAHPDSKVIGVSTKARTAIMPSGHRANVAYWFDDRTGNFITSSYYTRQLPTYAQQFNERDPAQSYVGKKWEGFPKWDFHAATGAERYSKLPASPWGNELIEKFAEQVVTGERLGQHDTTDLLTVSFSSNDYVGHAVGPDAPEVRDMAMRVDALIGQLFKLLDRQVGLKNVLIVLSADHGVAPLPERPSPSGSLGGRIVGHPEAIVRKSLSQKFGDADWLLPGGGEANLYLNWQAIDSFRATKPVSDHEILETAKAALLADPQLHILRVYTREQLDNGIAGDFVARAEMNGYYPRRSGDLAVFYEPFYVPGTHGASHFSPWAYDRHVPLIFMGSGIKGGRYDGAVAPNDIAPTLATLLDIQTPGSSSGRVLTEMLR